MYSREGDDPNGQTIGRKAETEGWDPSLAIPKPDETSAAQGGGADGKYAMWDGAAPLVLQLPNNKPIRSLVTYAALPTPSEIVLFAGASSGSGPGMFSTGGAAGTFALPFGQNAITLVSSVGAFASGSQPVYVTSDKLPPTVALAAVVATISGPVDVTASTALPVDASAGGPVAVSGIAGTVAISAAGVLTVKGNQTGGTIKTDGSGVTQPVSAAATLPNQAVSDYPSGATPIQLSGNAQFAAGILALGSIVPGAGKSFYIVTLAVKGLESQRIVWNVSGQSSGQAPHGCGDGVFVFHPAFVLVFTGVTLHLQLNTSDTPIGTMNVEYIVSGYCV